MSETIHSCPNCGQSIENNMEMLKFEATAELTKRTNRRRQAWVALFAMIGVVFSVIFAVPNDRIHLLKDIIELFFIVAAGIVATYHGASAWIARK